MAQKRLILSLSLAALALTGGAFAATIDPLLHGLQAGAPTSLWYDRVIAMESDAKSGEERVGVILTLERPVLPDLTGIDGLVIGSVAGTIATARLPLEGLDDLVAVPGIAHVAAARILRPTMDVAAAAANVDDVWNGAPAYTGAGVLIGVIDSGIDWRHEDFRLASGDSRIVAIWDLFGSGSPPPAGYSSGAEWDRAEIDAALAGGAAVTEIDSDGHGTHVSGIAAGNGRAQSDQYRGIAYEADILFAKPYSNGGFPEDKTIDAMNYLVQKAQSLGKPIAINMSLGGHFGPHDGTSAQEVLIDDLSGEGVVFCVAAGNEGEDYVSETGPASNHEFVLAVPAYAPNPGTENDVWVLAIWYDGATSASVSVAGSAEVPSGQTYTLDSTIGYLTIDNASQGADPQNGDKVCYVSVDDRTGTDVFAGNWGIAISGGSGQAHAWLITSSMVAGLVNSDQTCSVGMPGTAESAITVAAWKSRHSWPAVAGTVSYGDGTAWGQAAVGDHAPFSSLGPTRDGRQKPDVSAPGMAIVSCYSAETDPVAPDQLRVGASYFATQGTSMATPLVCGIVGLMLEKDPTLTAAEIRNILRTTASHDLYTGQGWNNEFGAGKVDALAALAAVSGGGTTAGDGNLNGDAVTSIRDVILLVNHILDPIGAPLTTEQRAAADVAPPGGGDGTLNIADVVRIVAFILGTDAPGKALSTPLAPATLAVGERYWSDGHWWIPVTLGGAEVAGGQFALTLPGAGWQPELARLDGDDDASVAAGLTGDQIRVLVFDPRNELAAAGVTVHLAYEVAVADEPTLAGALLVDGQGTSRDVAISRGGADLAGLRLVTIAPNPVRDEATVAFQLGRAQDVRVQVYDLKGRLVRDLPAGELAAGSHALRWDRRDGSGQAVAAGVYLVRVQTPRQVEHRKVIVQR